MNGIKITIIGMKNPCGADLKVGDTYLIETDGKALKMKDFDGCCPELVASILPTCMAMAYGAKLPWEDENGAVTSACPDPNDCVVAKVERINYN